MLWDATPLQVVVVVDCGVSLASIVYGTVRVEWNVIARDAIEPLLTKQSSLCRRLFSDGGGGGGGGSTNNHVFVYFQLPLDPPLRTRDSA